MSFFFFPRSSLPSIYVKVVVLVCLSGGYGGLPEGTAVAVTPVEGGGRNSGAVVAGRR